SASPTWRTGPAAGRPPRTGWSPIFSCCGRWGRSCGGLGAHASADLVDPAVAIEQVVGVERDDLPVRRHEVDARPLHATETEVEPVHELHDHDAKHILVREAGGRFEFRQAAEEFGEPLARVAWA